MDDAVGAAPGDLDERLRRFWIGIGLVCVLVAAVALWGAGLLRGAARTQAGLVSARAELDSLRRVQSEHAERQRQVAARLGALESLEEEVRTKADAAELVRLRRSFARLEAEMAALDSLRLRSAPAPRGPAGGGLP